MQKVRGWIVNRVVPGSPDLMNYRFQEPSYMLPFTHLTPRSCGFLLTVFAGLFVVSAALHALAEYNLAYADGAVYVPPAVQLPERSPKLAPTIVQPPEPSKFYQPLPSAVPIATTHPPKPPDKPHVVATEQLAPRIAPTTCRAVRLNPLICAPSFLIIGTSYGFADLLANAIQSHPRVQMANGGCFFADEAQWRKGANGYWVKFQYSESIVTGDVCDGYMDEFGTRIPGRIHAMLPAAKKLVLLRDPIERFETVARSMGKMPDELWVTHGKKEMDEALQCKRVGGYDRTCLMRIQAIHKTYVVQGLYKELLGQYEMYDAEVVMVIWEKEFFEENEQVMQKVFNFIGIEDWPVIRPIKPIGTLPRTGSMYHLSNVYREELRKFYE